MRLTVEERPGVLSLNYMWLPTWIGMNHTIKKEIEEKIGRGFKGHELTTETLDAMDEAIIGLLQEKFPSILFEEYLRALKHVRQEEEEG